MRLQNVLFWSIQTRRTGRVGEHDNSLLLVLDKTLNADSFRFWISNHFCILSVPKEHRKKRIEQLEQKQVQQQQTVLQQAGIEPTHLITRLIEFAYQRMNGPTEL